MIVLDTCALLWWTLQPQSLSPAGLRLCERIAVDGGCVSAISIWEIGIKWRRDAALLGGLELREYVHRIEQIAGLECVPVSGAIWTESILLNWPHRDPADRVIVATARLRNARILTKDGTIAAFYDKAVW